MSESFFCLWEFMLIFCGSCDTAISGCQFKSLSILPGYLVDDCDIVYRLVGLEIVHILKQKYTRSRRESCHYMFLAIKFPSRTLILTSRKRKKCHAYEEAFFFPSLLR